MRPNGGWMLPHRDLLEMQALSMCCPGEAMFRDAQSYQGDQSQSLYQLFASWIALACYMGGTTSAVQIALLLDQLWCL